VLQHANSTAKTRMETLTGESNPLVRVQREKGGKEDALFMMSSIICRVGIMRTITASTKRTGAAIRGPQKKKFRKSVRTLAVSATSEPSYHQVPVPVGTPVEGTMQQREIICSSVPIRAPCLCI
jgi:hypothetical protein